MTKKKKHQHKLITTRRMVSVMLAAVFTTGICLLVLQMGARNRQPERVFWQTIAQNMQTSSVTKTISQKTDEVSIREVSDLQFRAQLLSRKTTTVERQDQSISSKVVTESIGTNTDDFLRYTNLFSSYHGGLENQLNKWANARPSTAQDPEELTGVLFSTPLIFGYLSPAQQDNLVSQLQQHAVYTFNPKDVTYSRTKNGVKTYDYPVTINWNQYTAIYKQYLKMIGLEKSANGIEGPTEPTTFKVVLSINPKTHQITSFYMADAYIVLQEFSNYDMTQSITVPTKTDLSITELQKNINEQVQ